MYDLRFRRRTRDSRTPKANNRSAARTAIPAIKPVELVLGLGVPEDAAAPEVAAADELAVINCVGSVVRGPGETGLAWRDGGGTAAEGLVNGELEEVSELDWTLFGGVGETVGGTVPTVEFDTVTPAESVNRFNTIRPAGLLGSTIVVVLARPGGEPGVEAAIAGL